MWLMNQNGNYVWKKGGFARKPNSPIVTVFPSEDGSIDGCWKHVCDGEYSVAFDSAKEAMEDADLIYDLE